MPNKCTRQPTSPARRQLAAPAPATRLHKAADAKIPKHHRHSHGQQQMHMSIVIPRGLMQPPAHLPRATGSRHREDPKENSRQLQPKLIGSLHKRPPHCLAKPLPAALQPLPGQHHLRRRLRSLLSQSSRGRLSRHTRRAWPIRSLPRRGRIRCRRRIHRGHQRLSRCTSPKSQRTSKPNRIHTQSVAVPPRTRKQTSSPTFFLISIPRCVVFPRLRIRTKKGGSKSMKSTLWTIIDLCAAATGCLVFGCRHILPVELLAHRPENFWDDHPTVVETT